MEERLITDTPQNLESIFDSTFNEADARMVTDYYETVLENQMVTDQIRKKEPYINENKTGRNELCPCGSGKKYKYCCGR